MLLRTYGSGFSLTRLSRLGPVALRAILAGGETGAATGSRRANDLLFGADMTFSGTSVGRSYLGVPRMHPIAGTTRSLGKLLRRELSQLKGGVWWNPLVHPLVFCSFGKTLTAMWHAPHIKPHLANTSTQSMFLRYRWWSIAPINAPNPRSHLALRHDQMRALRKTATRIRTQHCESFLHHTLGFFNAPQTDKATSPSTPTDSVYPPSQYTVLDTISIRAWFGQTATVCIQREMKRLKAQIDARRDKPPAERRAENLKQEASYRRLEELDFALQLWVDQMLDLAYWMQRTPNVRSRGYRDGPDLHRATSLLLYPHGRRFVSIYDLPDLVPWLPYTSACQDRTYWSPEGGAGGMSVPLTTSDKSGGTAPSMSTANQGMAALSHMVLSKSNPHPCKVRNLDQIGIRNAIQDPPVGLAAMDMVHIMFMGNYPGCKHRPSFATRARIRIQSIAFRGATAQETSEWIHHHYHLLHLSFKIWYLQTVRWSPAYEAVMADVQSHAEYAQHSYKAIDQIHLMLAAWGRPNARKFNKAIWNGTTDDFVVLPPPKILDDAAHMSHGQSLCTFGKLRKGPFVTTLWDRMRSWLRSQCTKKGDMSMQYKEELTQMIVLSKIMQSQPEYGARVVHEIQTRKAQEEAIQNDDDDDNNKDTGLDPIARWALGVPLAQIPTALIHSFLKWEGDSMLSVCPWFGDRSYFLLEPYPFLGDLDTLYAIDLAAWMCARRTDGRFVMSWLRNPIGLSPMAYQRLQTLYFSYECCDVPDNSFLVQLRRFLFRRRRRVIPAAEYKARIEARDPSIMQRMTEPIQRVSKSDDDPNVLVLSPVAYRIVEEYSTPQSRRDFAIIFEYVNRVVAYSTWSVIPLPRRVMEHQIEAVRRKQTIEPWRVTDTDLLGSKYLCTCGRWCSHVVTPPLRSVTSSASNRRRSLCPGTDVRHLVDRIQEETRRKITEVSRDYQRQSAVLQTKLDEAMDRLAAASLATEGSSSSDLGEPPEEEMEVEGIQQEVDEMNQLFGKQRERILLDMIARIEKVEAEQPIMYNVVPTRRSSRSTTSGKETVQHGGSVGGKTYSSTGSSSRVGSGAISILDESDVRLTLTSTRWTQTDLLKRAPHTAPSQHPLNITGTRRKRKGSSSTVMVLPNASEPITRDVHPSPAVHIVGNSFVACDLSSLDQGGRARLVSQRPKHHATYCKGELFRVNLLGQAIRPKGPRATMNGPWYTLCATCGSLTTLDLGRWNHLGPMCGGHGRPHRLPDRLEVYDPRIDGSDVLSKGLVRARFARHTVGEKNGQQDLSRTSALPPPSTVLGAKIRSMVSLLDANAGLPCPSEIPHCWYCDAPVDHRKKKPSANKMDPQQSSQDASGAEIDSSQQYHQTHDIDAMTLTPPAIRYAPGTSVATAVAGSAGSAIYAQRLTMAGTHQAPPIRRINLRGSVFGRLEGDGSMFPAQMTTITAATPHQCATNACACISNVLNNDRAATGDMDTLEELGRVLRRHASTVESRILPGELLPAVGNEMAILVLDDVGREATMRFRWIYLCPKHMKDLRMGWIALQGRVEQIEVEQRAKEALAAVGGDITRIKDPDLFRAAAGQRIGRGGMVRRMFQRMPLLLSMVLNSFRRAKRTRMRQQIRFERSGLGCRQIPDYTIARKNRD